MPPQICSRIQPYANYPSTAAAPNSSSRASLFVHSSVQQTAEDVSHLCTETAAFAPCTIIFRSFKMTIVSVYIDVLLGALMRSAFVAYAFNFLVTSSFNAQHTLQGNKRKTPRGTATVDEIELTNLIILNDGSPTCFSHRGEPSVLDLTLASPDLDVYW